MIWTPPEVLESERVARVKHLHDNLLQTIKEHPIPAAEVLAALGGVATYIIALNVDKYSQALEMVGQLKREMKTSLTKHWPRFTQIREAIRNGIREGQKQKDPTG